MNPVLVNGSEAGSVPITDRGFQYGDGIFETLAVCDGAPLLWEAHERRLLSGCRALKFDRLPDVHALKDEAFRLSAGRDRAVLKLVITRGSGRRGYRKPPDAVPTRVVMVSPWPENRFAGCNSGARIRLCRTALSRQPELAGVKHLNRLEQILARAEWHDDWDEGLMCDQDGLVIEATTCNVFAVRDAKLYTPDLKHCGVAGIMRDQVIRIAREAGLDVLVVELTAHQLSRADELFLTNSVVGIWPVCTFEERALETGPITRSLHRALHEQPDRLVVD